MEQFFSDLLDIYGMFIDFIFSFDMGNGITLGYAALGLLLIATIFVFVLGRLKRSR